MPTLTETTSHTAPAATDVIDALIRNVETLRLTVRIRNLTDEINADRGDTDNVQETQQ